MADLNDAEKLLRDLYTVSGLRVSLHDTEFREVASYPRSPCRFCALLQENPKAALRCRYTDRDTFERVRYSGKKYIYHCSFGLYEMACPLYKNGILVGYMMMGQGLDACGCRETVLSAAAPYAADPGALAAALDSLPAVACEKMEAFAGLMSLCGERLAGVPALFREETASLGSAVMGYINRNIGKRLTVEGLCRVFNCCKSTITQAFRKECGTTVNDYIISRRMTIAKELLQYSEEPVGVIANRCGYADPLYFTKTFTKYVGVSPTGFRKDPFGI